VQTVTWLCSTVSKQTSTLKACIKDDLKYLPKAAREPTSQCDGGKLTVYHE